MKIDILTLFPEMFNGPFSESIIKRAVDKGLVEIGIHNLRDWAIDRHKTVDGSPYGGGAGMVMRVDVVDKAVNFLKEKSAGSVKVILLDTKGKKFTQPIAEKFSLESHLILIAGHYEGLDHRIHEHIADEVISIGEFVLTGGELPGMIIVDAVVRLLPGVLGNPESLADESYSLQGRDETEYPQYTRPEEYNGWRVPDVLLTGHHAQIENWRKSSRKKPAS